MSPTTVVLPTYDNVGELRRCVDSLLAQSHRPNHILVCVDGSTDGTLAYLAEMVAGDDRIVALSHPGNANRGRAASRNLVLGRITAGYVWYVDSDMVLDPEALANHLEVAVASGGVSVGAVDYRNADTAVWAGYLESRGRHRRADGEVLPFTQFTTANALVRAEHVLALGGFDDRFNGYGGEDLDFAYRLQESTGEPFINNRRAIATTIEDKTTEQALAQFETYASTNIHLLERLHPELPRTFELQRMSSSRLEDRAFASLMNPLSDAIASILVRSGPRPLRNQALSYKVIRAVWRGYRAGLAAR